MDGKLALTVPLTNPFRDLICRYMEQEFPIAINSAKSMMEALTTIIIGTNATRFGPMPGPESLVAIRSVIMAAVEANKPIPMLVPWGSKKPKNTPIDIAEVAGLKMLNSLQHRVQQVGYTPGVNINLRIEDVGGYWLFADEGLAARHSSEMYVQDMEKLVRILNLSFINTRLESSMMDELAYMEVAKQFQPMLVRYITDTDVYGFDKYQELASWKALSDMGWKGMIPREQREFYRERYMQTIPGMTKQGATEKLATYFAGSVARHRLNGTGKNEEWGSSFLQLNFAPPVPGAPASLFDKTIYSRTMPQSFTRNHIPPWRAHGYLMISGSNEITPKIASWGEQLPLEHNTITFARNGESVIIQAEQLIK
jgi:hypothetical protein